MGPTETKNVKLLCMVGFTDEHSPDPTTVGLYIKSDISYSNADKLDKIIRDSLTKGTELS